MCLSGFPLLFHCFSLHLDILPPSSSIEYLVCIDRSQDEPWDGCGIWTKTSTDNTPMAKWYPLLHTSDSFPVGLVMCLGGESAGTARACWKQRHGHALLTALCRSGNKFSLAATQLTGTAINRCKIKFSPFPPLTAFRFHFMFCLHISECLAYCCTCILHPYTQPCAEEPSLSSCSQRKLLKKAKLPRSES